MPSPQANADAPSFVVTMTLIVADVARSQALYRDVFGATVLRQSDASRGEPAFCDSATSGSAPMSAAAPPTTSPRSSRRRRCIPTS
jgi:catechol 2,3-dioxygenase-like lactoylglutathione lyase family enzyme